MTYNQRLGYMLLNKMFNTDDTPGYALLPFISWKLYSNVKKFDGSYI